MKSFIPSLPSIFLTSALTVGLGFGLSAGPGVVAAADLPPEYQFAQKLFPGIEVSSVKPSPVAGVLQMEVGADIYYISADGKYLLQGELYDIAAKQNLTEIAKEDARLAYVTRFGDDESILFAADNPVAEVLVFTDIDCGYCRKLHREIDGYNKNGISIRYLFFPRSGPGTESWRKAEQVWCAESRQEALTHAKNNESFPSTDCDASVVGRHYSAVKELGLSGTPAILTTKGRLIVGYRSPDDLLELLQEDI